MLLDMAKMKINYKTCHTSETKNLRKPTRFQENVHNLAKLSHSEASFIETTVTATLRSSTFQIGNQNRAELAQCLNLKRT